MPMTSQPTSSMIRSPATTTSSMAAVKRLTWAAYGGVAVVVVQVGDRVDLHGERDHADREGDERGGPSTRTPKVTVRSPKSDPLDGVVDGGRRPDGEHDGDEQRAGGAGDAEGRGGRRGPQRQQEPDEADEQRRRQRHAPRPGEPPRSAITAVDRVSQRHLVDGDAGAQPVELEHDRQPHADLGGGQHDDEQREDLAGVRQRGPHGGVGGDQDQVDRVEHAARRTSAASTALRRRSTP